MTNYRWITDNVPPIDDAFELSAVRALISSGFPDDVVRTLHPSWNGDRIRPALADLPD